MKYYINKQLNIVAGGDFNVQLPAGHETLTGAATYRMQTRSHQLRSEPVLSWMEFHGLRALNTFHNPPQWTWGKDRHRCRKSQIDYLFCSPDVDGWAFPQPQPGTILHTSDHLPVLGGMHFPEPAANIEAVGYDPSLKGWAPMDEACLAHFQKEAIKHALGYPNLDEYEDKLGQIVGTLKHTTTSSRARLEMHGRNAKLKEARRNIAGSVGAERQLLVRQMRTMKQQLRKEKSIRKLRCMRVGTINQQHTPLALVSIGGQRITDRALMTEAAMDFGEVEDLADCIQTATTSINPDIRYAAGTFMWNNGYPKDSVDVLRCSNESFVRFEVFRVANKENNGDQKH